MTCLPLSFERSLFRATVRFKQEHPGVLEGMTKRRKQKKTGNNIQTKGVGDGAVGYPGRPKDSRG